MSDWVGDEDSLHFALARETAPKLVEFVRNFAYLGHPDVKPVFRLMDGQLGLMPTPSGWQTVRVENGKPITLPQLISLARLRSSFVSMARTRTRIGPRRCVQNHW
jgi:hypothetical protein